MLGDYPSFVRTVLESDLRLVVEVLEFAHYCTRASALRAVVQCTENSGESDSTTG